MARRAADRGRTADQARGLTVHNGVSLARGGSKDSPFRSFGSVRHLAQATELRHAREALIELDALARFERPLPVMTDYDALLGQEVAQ